jgi:hypothetical protein
VKPIALNLASRPFRNNVVVGLLLGGIGAALVGGTAYNLYVYLSYGASYARLQHDQAEDRARITALQAEEKRLVQEIKARNFKQAYERGKIANDLIRKSAFSWTALFNTLETVVPPDVVMTAIRPNITGDGIVLRIEGVAKNSEAFRNLQDKLLRHPSFAKVFPSNEKHLNPNLPDVTFLLTCDYVPPATVPAVLTADANAAQAGAAPAPAAPAPAAPAPAAPDATATAAPATVPATVAATQAPSAPAAPPAAPPAAAPTVAAAHTAATVVGRDGRPFGPPGETIVAPGGVAFASLVTPAPRKGKHTTRAGAPASAAASRKSSPAGTAMAGSGAAAKAATARATQVTAAAPAPAVDGLVQPARERLPVPHAHDPNLQALARPKPEPPPAAAQRVDLPLTFVSRPAAEVYQRLAVAHGVSIELDPSVDPKTPVTVNLQGRSLDVALKLLEGLLHTQVRHPSDGVYRVASGEVVSPAASPPPLEEDLPANKPPAGGVPPATNRPKPPGGGEPREGYAP